VKVAVGLGTSLALQDRHAPSRLAARAARLELTVRQLDATPGLRLLRVSPWVSTPPLRGGTARGVFLNGVALFESELDPHAILARCVELEEGAGRRRGRWWGDRTLDLDVLLVEGLVLADERLMVPHPAIADRPFVLGPLLAVWPEAVDPHDGSRWADRPAPAGPRPVWRGQVAFRGPLGYL
jgi:2-amino-4-hydroxy-6-hydroxymethyldihydropteridine diphosphokinase